MLSDTEYFIHFDSHEVLCGRYDYPTIYLSISLLTDFSSFSLLPSEGTFLYARKNLSCFLRLGVSLGCVCVGCPGWDSWEQIWGGEEDMGIWGMHLASTNVGEKRKWVGH